MLIFIIAYVCVLYTLGYTGSTVIKYAAIQLEDTIS